MPYHVRITHKSQGRADTVVLDRDEAWLRQGVVEPHATGTAMFVGGQVIEWSEVDAIHITHNDRKTVELMPSIRSRRARSRAAMPQSDEWYVAESGTDVTERFLRGAPGSAAVTSTPATAENSRAVMVVWGHDQEATHALYDWLRAIGLSPREWGQLTSATQSSSPFIGAVLEQAFREVQAVVALLTPDEHVATRDQLTGRPLRWRLQPRPNVLVEAGMAFAIHPLRTVLVVVGEPELPSDFAGRDYVRVHDAASLRNLARKLETAGCPVDLSGEQWTDVTRFPDRSGVAPEPRAGDGP